jgi:hypothetical protein
VPISGSLIQMRQARPVHRRRHRAAERVERCAGDAGPVEQDLELAAEGVLRGSAQPAKQAAKHALSVMVRLDRVGRLVVKLVDEQPFEVFGR